MSDIREYIAALLQHWWALMSCAVFTLLSLFGALRGKGRTWVIQSTSIAAVGLFVLASYLAWLEEHSLRINLQTARPYVLIEELSPAQIEALSLASPKNPVRPPGAYDRAYIFYKAPNCEALLYDIRDVSKTVVARNVRQYQKVLILDGNGQEREVPLLNNAAILILYPEQMSMYQTTFPSGTLYAQSPKSLGSVRITLLLTYTGQESDKNVYYYKVVLKANQNHTTADLNKHAMGAISVDSIEDGIVKDLAQLRR